MADFHRKIELQSTEDLQYLVANARRAAKEYLDKDFPPDLRDEGDNTLHERIERNVDDYINATFAAAAPNLTINGLDISPAMLQTILNSDTNSVPLEIEEHEPFDTRLFERAKMLARQEEELIEEIAMLRRSVPGKVVESRKKGFGEVERDESVVKAAEEKIEGGEGVVIEGLEMERQKNMEKSWEGAVKGVEGLMNTLPEVVARKERAEEAERYILGKKGKGKARK